MSLSRKMATAGAVAVVGLGLGAVSASAYSISGGYYVGRVYTDVAFSFGGLWMYPVTCSAIPARFTGFADGTDETWFTPSYGGAGDCDFLGLPASATQSGQWSVKITTGPDASGVYEGDVAIPSGASTTIDVPLAGCTVVISGPQTFGTLAPGLPVAMGNVTGGARLTVQLRNIWYTASGCPFPDGYDGTYDTGGVYGWGGVDILGISVS